MKTTNDRNEATGGQGWGRSVCVGGMAVLALGLASCAGSKTRPMAGAAMIDAVSKKDDQTRVRKSRIISVKGAKSHGREAHIAAGLTEVKVRYNWPQGGEQEVDLRFRAHPDRKYFVKYAAFPPSVDKLSGTTALSTSAEGFAGLGNKVIASGGHCPAAQLLAATGGTALYAPGIVLGTVDYWGRVGADIADKHKAVQWVDMMVISEKQHEGVVRFVRVYPSGKVVWKPWDVCSNAPGNPQHGRRVGGFRELEVAGRGRASSDTFKRHQIAE